MPGGVAAPIGVETGEVAASAQPGVGGSLQGLEPVGQARAMKVVKESTEQTPALPGCFELTGTVDAWLCFLLGQRLFVSAMASFQMGSLRAGARAAAGRLSCFSRRGRRADADAIGSPERELDEMMSVLLLFRLCSAVRHLLLQRCDSCRMAALA